MPTIRYEIKNAYGLGSRQLYGAAEKGDSEAILEGVAMAGLTGLLRQLGDLADLAAGIFHELQEEVLNTASRGHGLVLRLQQLEAEFPSMEKNFIAQSTYSHFSYTEGMKWHHNLQKDQNVITAGHLPGFVMDSYKECRGPPQFYILDKFDIAGSGTCLKRFSDPSFFRKGLTSARLMEEEAQKEKGRHNIWKVVQSTIDESLNFSSTPKVNSILQNSVSEKELNEVPIKRVKLKSRVLNRDAYSLRGQIEHLFGVRPCERKLLSISPLNHSIRSINSYESASGLSGSIVYASADSEGSRNSSPTSQRMKDFPSHEFDKQSLESNSFTESMDEPVIKVRNASAAKEHAAYVILKKEMFYNSTNKTKGHVADYWPSEENSDPSSPMEVDQNGFLADAESRTEESSDGYISDDIASQTDNYMDALTTMESEIEVDAELRYKRDLRLYDRKSSGVDSDTTEEKQVLHDRLAKLSLAMDPSSPGFCNLFRKGLTNPSFSDTLGNMAAQLLEENIAGSTSPILSAFSSTEGSTRKFEKKRHAIMERKHSENSVSSVASMRSHKTLDISTSKSTRGEGNSGYSSQGSSYETPLDSSAKQEILCYNLEQIGNIFEEESKERKKDSKQLTDSSLHHLNLVNKVLVENSSEGENNVHLKAYMQYSGSESTMLSSRKDARNAETLGNQLGLFSSDEDHAKITLELDRHLLVDNFQSNELDAAQPNNILFNQFPSEDYPQIAPSLKQSKMAFKSTETKALNKCLVPNETALPQLSVDLSGESVYGSRTPDRDYLYESVYGSGTPDRDYLCEDDEETITTIGTEPQHGPNPDMTLFSKKLSQESIATESDMALPFESLGPLQVLAEEMKTMDLTEPQLVVDQLNELHSNGTPVNPPLPSSIEDVRNGYHEEASGQGRLRTRGASPGLDSKTSKEDPLSMKDSLLQPLDSSVLRHSLKHESSQLKHLLPNIDTEKTEDDASTSDIEIMPPSSLTFAAATAEKENDTCKGVPVALYANLPPLPRKSKNIKHGITTTKKESSSNIENEKPTEKHDSTLNPDRDALINAVAIHDKSTLKKIPELIRPSSNPMGDEGGSFLEQIKNKSFALKPTEMPKIKFRSGPPTNLKVIALLEKANAIRQACAGSDDEDSWSDS